MLHYTSDLIDKWTSRKEVKLIFPFFMSAIAEGVALVLELPFDTVRTRIQVFLSIADEPTRISIPFSHLGTEVDLRARRIAPLL